MEHLGVRNKGRPPTTRSIVASVTSIIEGLPFHDTVQYWLMKAPVLFDNHIRGRKQEQMTNIPTTGA